MPSCDETANGGPAFVLQQHSELLDALAVSFVVAPTCRPARTGEQTTSKEAEEAHRRDVTGLMLQVKFLEGKIGRDAALVGRDVI
jgi:hypothetical protein